MEWTIASAWKWVLSFALFCIIVWKITGKEFWKKMWEDLKKRFGG